MIIKNMKRLFVTMFFIAFLTAMQSPESAFVDYVLSIENQTFKYQGSYMFSGAQPTKEQLEELKNRGVNNVVNLRPDSEMTFDEAAFVESLGMSYFSLPVAGPAGVTFENAQTLHDHLAKFEDENAVLIHCASGNRVGALMALAYFKNNEADVEKALAYGQQWGMTALAPFVTQLLQAQ